MQFTNKTVTMFENYFFIEKFSMQNEQFTVQVIIIIYILKRDNIVQTMKDNNQTNWQNNNKTRQVYKAVLGVKEVGRNSENLASTSSEYVLDVSRSKPHILSSGGGERISNCPHYTTW